MSEFNTGKPPAGEAGMCRVDEDSSLPGYQYWSGDFFTTFSEQLANAVLWGRDGDRSIHQDLPWRWASLGELTAAGIHESEARGMVHKSMLAEQAEPTAAEVEATQNPAVMATDQNEAMKNRDALKRAITPPPKDEGWREYDPKYPPIQPYRMDFKTLVEGEHVRHFYRRADTSAVDVVLYARNGLILVAQWTNRLGGNWGAIE